MEREGKREEEERKKREEEAKRRVKMKRWLGVKKNKLREREMTNKQGLGHTGPGEGGILHPDFEKFDKYPSIDSLHRGGDCFERERGQGVEGERGVVTVTDNVIHERSQPKKICIVQKQNFEHHHIQKQTWNQQLLGVSMRAMRK